MPTAEPPTAEPPTAEPPTAEPPAADFSPRSGGMKLVFDVAAADVAAAVAHFRGAGLDVARYYPDDRPRRGGSVPGWVRLSAERALRTFEAAEGTAVTAELDAARTACPVPLETQGTERWTSGGGGGADAGDREPRRPTPRAGAGAGGVTRPAGSA